MIGTPRRSSATTIVLLALVGLLMALGTRTAQAQTPGPAAVLTSVVGTVEVRDPGASDWTIVSTGHAVAAGAIVRTGAGSKAELTHAVGVIRMFQHTVLRLPAERIGATTVVRRPELLAGQSLFDVVPSRIGAFVSRVSTHARSLFEVVTPHVVSGVKGTRFAVIELGGRTVVAVYEGKVEASDLDATPRDTVFLTYGQLAEYREGRLLRTQSFDFRDDWNRWAKPAPQRPSFVDPSVGNSAPELTEESRTPGVTEESSVNGGDSHDGTTTVSDTGDSGGGVIGAVTGTVGGVVGGVTDTVGGVVGDVGGTLGDTVGGITDVVGDTTDSLLDPDDSLVDTVGGVVDGVTDVVGGTVGGVIGTVGGLLGR